jgi:hypothetical protein
MVTCSVREIRRAGGRVVTGAPRDPEGSALPVQGFELPMDETGLTDPHGERPSGSIRSSGRS